MSETFSLILQRKLKEKNLSLVARELNIPKTLLHEWLNAKRLPSMKNIAHIKSLADYIGLTLDELLIGSNENRTISSISFEDSGRKYRINIERVE